MGMTNSTKHAIEIAIVFGMVLTTSVSARLAGTKAQKGIGVFAFAGPWVALALIAEVFLGRPRPTIEDVLYGCAITLYPASLGVALGLLIRTQPRWPWVLALAIDVLVLVAAIGLMLVVGMSRTD